jgi:hypothetical protein
MEIVAIADPRLAHLERRFRGIPIVDDEAAHGLEFDAAIISNLSPVHAARRLQEWRQLTDKPVIDLFAHQTPSRGRKP